MHARKKLSIFLKSMESQLSNANFIFKIGQKLASVSSFEIWKKFFFSKYPGKFKKMMHFLDARINFKNAYRSEFLSNFKNKISVRKLRLYTFQKIWNIVSCVHFARGLAKIATPHILAVLRAKCTQEKNFKFFKKYDVSAF